MTKLCAQAGLKLDNRRQEFQARVQENVQALILLYSSGICISLVVLLVLASALSLETKQEKYRYGILRTIGMSQKQMHLRILGTALVRSMTAVVVGWIVYGGYLAAQHTGDSGQAISDTFYSLKYIG